MCIVLCVVCKYLRVIKEQRLLRQTTNRSNKAQKSAESYIRVISTRGSISGQSGVTLRQTRSMTQCWAFRDDGKQFKSVHNFDSENPFNANTAQCMCRALRSLYNVTRDAMEEPWRGHSALRGRVAPRATTAAACSKEVGSYHTVRPPMPRRHCLVHLQTNAAHTGST